MWFGALVNVYRMMYNPSISYAFFILGRYAFRRRSFMATPSSPRRNKREDILQAAMRVFCYYGFDGSTLEKIAGEAGVSKALVIKYYGTQRNMLVLCLRRFVDELIEKLQKNAKKKENTYLQHMDYAFDLLKLSRPQLRLLVSIFCTPAHEDLLLELIPGVLRSTQGMMDSFTETKDNPAGSELNYAMYSMLAAYIIGGNEQNYLAARNSVLEAYGVLRAE